MLKSTFRVLLSVKPLLTSMIQLPNEYNDKNKVF